MKITEIAFIGHPVANLHAARAFYENILRLSPPTAIDGSLESELGHIEYDIAGTTLALTTAWSDGKKPETPCTGLVFEVEDFDAAVAHLRAHDVPFVLGPFESASCSVAVITDPDGNTMGIHQRKKLS